MRATFIFILAVCAFGFGAGCDTSTAFNAEGFKCDPGDVCPDGLMCVEGVCQRSAGVGGGGGGGAGGGDNDAGSGGGTGGGAGSDGGDLCSGVSCTTPPQNVCADANTLSVFSPNGTCNPSTGQCEYAATPSNCQSGCLNGACPDSLCEGVTCDAPPAAVCDDATTLRTYAANGTCDAADGLCDYGSTTQSCPNGCSAGTCLAVPLSFSQLLPNVRAAVSAVDQLPGSAGGHVLAVGRGGAVYKWDGAAWTKLVSGTTSNLNAVWLFEDTGNNPAGYIVGNAGTVLRYDGTSLTPVVVTGLSANLTSVHGNDDDSVIAAGGTQIAVKNSTGWAVQNPGIGNAFLAINGVFAEAGVLRAAGRCSRSAGVTVGPCVVGWTSANAAFAIDIDTAVAGTINAYLAIGPDANHGDSVYQFVSAGKTTRRYNYSAGTDSAAFDASVTAIVTVSEGAAIEAISYADTASTGAVYVLSQSGPSAFGALIRAVKSTGGAPANTRLLDLFGRGAISRNDSGGVIVADAFTESATIGRRGLNTNHQLTDLGEHWVSVDAVTGGTGYVFVNAYGDVASPGAQPGHFRITRNPAMETSPVIRDATGGGPTLMVGDGGRILLWQTTTYQVSEVTSPTAARLNAICRVSATQAYAVGSGGTVVSITGTGTSTAATLMTSAGSENLNDVICDGPAPVAVGDNGKVLRLSGSSWIEVTPRLTSNSNLTAVANTGGTLFVGSGTLFAKLENGAWTMTLPPRAGLSELQARSSTELYGISSDTVVRFNGTAWSDVLTATSGLVGSVAVGGSVVYVGSDGAVVEGK